MFRKMYYYDDEALSYKRVKPFMLFAIGILIGCSIGVGSTVLSFVTDKKETPQQEELVILLREEEKKNFKPQDAYNFLVELRAPFPEIMFAQAVLESGNFQSPLFKSNNNCYGMREPGKRLTTSKGDKNGYADFASWKDCILDRCFYNALYLSEIKTEAEYYQYLLNSNYAANMPNYVEKVKALVKTLNMKQSNQNTVE